MLNECYICRRQQTEQFTINLPGKPLTRQLGVCTNCWNELPYGTRLLFSYLLGTLSALSVALRSTSQVVYTIPPRGITRKEADSEETVT